MNKEILFRGKPKTQFDYYCFSQIWEANCKDGFVHGSLLVKDEKCYICVSALHHTNSCVNNGTTSMIEVLPETVCEYIGVVDKNGVEIFEHDIVKTKYGRLCIVVWFSSPAHNGWDLKVVDTIGNIRDTKGPSANDLWASNNLEVVDNIHKNPAKEESND